MTEDCIFCKIGAGEIESEILYRDDDCFVIKDIAPRAPLHLLVISLDHFTYLADLTLDDYPMLGGMFKAAQEMAGRNGVMDGGYRLIINQGRNAGQQVDHLHLHLLAGRLLGDIG